MDIVPGVGCVLGIVVGGVVGGGVVVVGVVGTTEISNSNSN